MALSKKRYVFCAVAVVAVVLIIILAASLSSTKDDTETLSPSTDNTTDALPSDGTTGPETPTEPEKPAEPEKPVDPTVPVEPAVPVDPGKEDTSVARADFWQQFRAHGYKHAFAHCPSFVRNLYEHFRLEKRLSPVAWASITISGLITSDLLFSLCAYMKFVWAMSHFEIEFKNKSFHYQDKTQAIAGENKESQKISEVVNAYIDTANTLPGTFTQFGKWGPAMMLGWLVALMVLNYAFFWEDRAEIFYTHLAFFAGPFQIGQMTRGSTESIVLITIWTVFIAVNIVMVGFYIFKIYDDDGTILDVFLYTFISLVFPGWDLKFWKTIELSLIKVSESNWTPYFTVYAVMLLTIGSSIFNIIEYVRIATLYGPTETISS